MYTMATETGPAQNEAAHALEQLTLALIALLSELRKLSRFSSDEDLQAALKASKAPAPDAAATRFLANLVALRSYGN